MGTQCVFTNLQSNRHKCACCNKFVHAIGPCGNEQADGTIICGLCESIHERDNAALNLKQQRAAAALRKKQADPEKPSIGPRDHATRKKAASVNAKQALMEKKINQGGRVIEAAMKENGILEGAISDPEVFVSAGSGSTASDDSSDIGSLAPLDATLEATCKMPGKEYDEYSTKTGACPALGRFCNAPTDEYLLGDKCLRDSDQAQRCRIAAPSKECRS